MSDRESIDAVRSNFADRHIGPNEYQIKTMLLELGFDSLEKFVEKVVPANIFWNQELDLPQPVSETQALAEIKELAKSNQVKRSMIGTGYYATKLPNVILRNVLENPAWYTAYTPYQPEISQGRLEVLFAFQTLISDLTGLPIANASMLDEATAAAEAMTLAHRATKASDSAVFLIDKNLHPQVKAVIETRAEPLNITVKQVEFSGPDYQKIDNEIFGAILAYPASDGSVNDLTECITWLHSKSALVILDTDPLFLTLHKSVSEIGGDIAVGSAQRFGTPMGFGGPHAGFLSVRLGLERSLPGRLVGQSIDAKGEPAYRLALQTREQHIRRDKATSNICTAQVLLAVINGLYAIYHGPAGLKAIASTINQIANTFYTTLKEAGFSFKTKHFFDTLTITNYPKGKDAGYFLARANSLNFNFRRDNQNPEHIGISFDEVSDDAELIKLYEIFEVENDGGAESKSLNLNTSLERKSEYLSHPIFNTYHSETAMLRYMRNLADRDLALDRTMIPLGSCTMKLNATAEMIPVTWPEFSQLHPYAPVEQVAGFNKLISQLSSWLTEVTGYDAVSLQPNAGSQGEFAGLLAIRKYLDSKNGKNRKICLIPESAHGTNAASAVMAGMQVVVIKCDEYGNVSISDIKEKIAQYQDQIAALMVTYPSTHGVFESAISEICGLIHDAGGQVYVDGANLNALVGLSKPGKFGADVSHLNLHKTFCIPHGGGGPGVGPVIVRKHLADFLPGNPLAQSRQSGQPGESKVGPVSAANFGSASILPISWMYIRMMGAQGLKKATSVAILSANYLAKKLEPDFPILYRGESGFIAHECIIDLREITKQTGVTVDDVAKRLMDHGFHAPTVSFPVAGTMMIEPTESEDIRELDRFLEAMHSIREEIRDIENGKLTVEESALRFAPHTANDLLAEKWDRKYSREVAAFPNGRQIGMGRVGKYWPTVSRIDGAHGDRNLVCACVPIEEYAKAER